MLKLMLTMLTFMSSIMAYTQHPFSLSFMLLIQTVIISLTTRLMYESSWIPLTLMLIMMGGIMIIFMYFTSICSNQQFSKQNFLYNLFYTMLWLPLILSQYTYLFKSDSLSISNFNFKEYYKIFMPLNSYCSIFMFCYLILALLVMINLLNFNTGPLRKKY
uniref:NADH dehydrogenase subunit 6 n=1 Tax=Allocarsidara bakeri TaxID=2218082 RepID=A0A344A237_9HEMI|nr:NADH dehydrogenase subunit 6 [Allocarsidara bakeri]AWU48828.1 NADH dehydrogenase subunit 6 [Allocarsidara bakeri]